MSAVKAAARPASAPAPAGALPATHRLRRPESAAIWIALAAAAAAFLLAFNGGFYEPQDREALAVVVWWAIALGAILGLWPRSQVPRNAVVAGGLLAAFAAWTGLSALWAPAPEIALAELGRVLLYLGIFTLAVLATRSGDAGRIADGLGLGVAAVAALALASRLFPDLVGATELDRLLPGAVDRLTYPVDYWNGLGILLGLGFPLLLRTATTVRAARWRALSLAPVPVLACAIYLTSSRGGILVAVTGMVVLVALTDRRVLTAAATALGLGASALAITVLRARDAVVDGPFDGDLAASQGSSAALLVVLICLLCGSLALLLAALAPVRPRLPPGLRAGGVVAAVVAAVVALALVHPRQRFEEFRQPPGSGDVSIESHLFSAGGSGRWQFWDGALEQFAAHPLAGDGAGSYESWWAVNGSIPYFLRDAHSVWLETMGELGLLGIALLVAFFAAALFGGALAIRRGPPEERATPAALTAVVIAFCAGAAVDWMWEMTVVAAIAVLCAGLLAGPAARTRATAPPPAAPGSAGAPSGEAAVHGPRRLAFVPRVVLVEVALTAVALVLLPLLSEHGLDQSRAAAQRGDAAGAAEAALSARRLAPWTSGPPQQLALVQESAGDLRGASVWVDKAIEENDSDWRLWLLATRIQTASGQAERARASLRRAKALNPKSKIFAARR